MANETQAFLRSTHRTITCSKDACTHHSDEDDNDRKRDTIQCNPAACTGFTPPLLTTCMTRDTNSAFQAEQPACPASSFVGWALSDEQFHGAPVPKLLAPGFSQIYADHPEVGLPFYTDPVPNGGSYELPMIEDMRALAQEGVGATIAFLVAASDLIPAQIPSTCGPPVIR